MQEAISPQRRFILPFWIRISLAALMFFDAVLYARKACLQFEWAAWFCFGMYWLIDPPRQKGEPLTKCAFQEPTGHRIDCLSYGGTGGIWTQPIV